MSKTIDVDRLMDKAPVLHLRTNEGTSVHESQVLVGAVHAPAITREHLELYGVCMDYATFEAHEQRWTRCLFSEGAAEILAELSAAGQFPYAFQATPSAGHIVSLEAQVAGRQPPTLPLKEWVTPAPPEALARAVASGWIPSAWLRRSRGYDAG